MNAFKYQKYWVRLESAHRFEYSLLNSDDNLPWQDEENWNTKTYCIGYFESDSAYVFLLCNQILSSTIRNESTYTWATFEYIGPSSYCTMIGFCQNENHLFRWSSFSSWWKEPHLLNRRICTHYEWLFGVSCGAKALLSHIALKIMSA